MRVALVEAGGVADGGAVEEAVAVDSEVGVAAPLPDASEETVAGGGIDDDDDDDVAEGVGVASGVADCVCEDVSLGGDDGVVVAVGVGLVDRDAVEDTLGEGVVVPVGDGETEGPAVAVLGAVDDGAPLELPDRVAADDPDADGVEVAGCESVAAAVRLPVTVPDTVGVGDAVAVTAAPLAVTAAPLAVLDVVAARDPVVVAESEEDWLPVLVAVGVRDDELLAVKLPLGDEVTVRDDEALGAALRLPLGVAVALNVGVWLPLGDADAVPVADGGTVAVAEVVGVAVAVPDADAVAVEEPVKVGEHVGSGMGAGTTPRNSVQGADVASTTTALPDIAGT